MLKDPKVSSKKKKRMTLCKAMARRTDTKFADALAFVLLNACVSPASFDTLSLGPETL
jgi:hypothetical protein